jgi:hypothetical protein
MGILSAFGYRPAPDVLPEPAAARVSEAKHSDTLQPYLVLYFRWDGEEEVGIPLPLEFATDLLGEAIRCALRADDRHFARATDEDGP